jgi:excinuclease ABC subunit C
MNREYFKAKLVNLPHEPGSYQMKDAAGTVIYVGKAKDLHNRVNQYFTGAHDFKTTKMVSRIEDFDFIVTRSEKEALVLEINLIKKYRPKYNIQFMDDSSYPYIKLTHEDYPRLVVCRDSRRDRRARYFGPYPDASAARSTQKVLLSLYPFRRCQHMGDKVCLYYHMGQCLGPCEFPVDPAVYKEMGDQAARFLNGDTRQVVDDLKKKMQEASDALEFEKAGQYKEMLDSIAAITQDRQIIEQDQRADADAFAWYADKGYIAISGFLVRHGTVLAKEWKLHPLYGQAEEEFVNFLIQYYDDHPAARELLVPMQLDGDTVAQLREILPFAVSQPQKGYRRKLLALCTENARRQLELKFQTVETQDSQTDEAVAELSRLAGRPMNRVELFDNSHISGTFTVAACVVYEDGRPSRKDYRLYKLHTANSDVDSMKEVLYRRYFRLLKEQGRMPDGILVDGGKAQIDAARQVLEPLGLADTIKIMGLAKDDRHTTDALVDSDGRRLAIDKNGPLFFLLTRMQDEVHRVAITYHRKLRAKAETRSILDEIEGVGPKRKRLLLRTFGGFGGLKQATPAQIAEVVPEKVAAAVYDALHEGE